MAIGRIAVVWRPSRERRSFFVKQLNYKRRIESNTSQMRIMNDTILQLNTKNS